MMELTRPFDMDKIKEILFRLKHNKAAGGLPADFYLVFWEVVKGDLKEMFDAFHSGARD
jgi:hypothetical protein